MHGEIKICKDGTEYQRDDDTKDTAHKLLYQYESYDYSNYGYDVVGHFSLFITSLNCDGMGVENSIGRWVTGW